MSAYVRKTDRMHGRVGPMLPSADTLFLQGKDTAEIAAIHGVTEDVVLRRLSIQRSKRLCLPSPYGAKA